MSEEPWGEGAEPVTAPERSQVPGLGPPERACESPRSSAPLGGCNSRLECRPGEDIHPGVEGMVHRPEGVDMVRRPEGVDMVRRPEGVDTVRRPGAGGMAARRR